MANFNSVFKDLRKKSGLTQDELGKKLGVSRSAIGMWETGERKPDNIETMELIADYFNVDMNYLTGKKITTEIIPTAEYFDENLRYLAYFLKENPKYKVLFDAATKVNLEDIESIKQIMDKFSGEK